MKTTMRSRVRAYVHLNIPNGPGGSPLHRLGNITEKST